MKSTDLMINDWVFIEQEPHMVSYLTNYNFGHMQVAVISDGCKNNPYFFGCIEPIPITEEILSENGFKITSDKAVFTYRTGLFSDDRKNVIIIFNHNDNGYDMEIYNDISAKVGIKKITGTIIYVHEFQHALRLCGLDELANNFKI